MKLTRRIHEQKPNNGNGNLGILIDKIIQSGCKILVTGY